MYRILYVFVLLSQLEHNVSFLIVLHHYTIIHQSPLKLPDICVYTSISLNILFNSKESNKLTLKPKVKIETETQIRNRN